MYYTLAQLAELCGGIAQGDKGYRLKGVNNLREADASQLSMYTSKSYTAAMRVSNAGALLTTAPLSNACSGNLIIAENPLLALAKILNKYHKSNDISDEAQVCETAKVSPNAILGKTVFIGSNAVIGDRVKLGDGVRISAGVVIEEGSTIGAFSQLDANVTVYSNCSVGERCHISSGTVIGSDGFGFAEDTSQTKPKWVAIPQISGVNIGDDVHIGSNTSIDRGSLGNTVIGNGVIIDNLIQIAHNVQIGEHTAIAACTGIAGSAIIGKNCQIAGRVSINGHLEICDNTVVLTNAFVTKSILKPGVYSSAWPAMPVQKWRKMLAKFRLHSIK